MAKKAGKKKKKQINMQKAFAIFCVSVMVISFFSSIIIYFI